jgi:hypothetical protein
MVTDFDKVVPPGGSGKIVARIKTENLRGDAPRDVAVVSNSAENPHVTLKCVAVVKPVFIVEPEDRVTTKIKQGESFEQKFTIRQDDGKPFTLSKMENTSDLFRVTLVPKEGKKSDMYTLTMKLRSSAEIVRAVNQTQFETDNPRKKILDIVSDVNVQGPVVFAPIALIFKGTELNETKEVKLYPSDFKKPFKIGKITAPKGITAVVRESKGSIYLLDITLSDVAYVQPGTPFEVSVETDQKAQPVVKIPLAVMETPQMLKTVREPK